MKHHLPPEGRIRYQTVCGVVGLSKATVMRLVAAQRFPAPIKLGARINLWEVSEVRAWLASPDTWGTK